MAAGGVVNRHVAAVLIDDGWVACSRAAPLESFTIVGGGDGDILREALGGDNGAECRTVEAVIFAAAAV